MYAKRIIPCLDLKNGRVVKGTNFVGLRDAGDPVECAIEYDSQGADELVGGEGVPERGPAAPLELSRDAQGAGDAEAASGETLLVVA